MGDESSTEQLLSAEPEVTESQELEGSEGDDSGNEADLPAHHLPVLVVTAIVITLLFSLLPPFHRHQYSPSI